MTQKSNINSKYFLAESLIAFGLILLSFILFIIATVVIGFDNQLSNSIVTLKTMHKEIVNSNGSMPTYYLGSYSLIIVGIVFAGIASILISLNLLPFKKLIKAHIWFYWGSICLISIAMILVLIGEILYVSGTVTDNYPLKLSDCFGMYRFPQPFILIAVPPLALIIFVIFIKVKEKKEQQN